MKVRGRVEADAIAVDQGPKNKAIYGDFENAVGFRRARLGAEGTAGDQVNWVSEFDLAAGQVAVKDVFVRLDRLPVLRAVQVGHQQEPFSLEGMTSSNVFPFAEFSPGIALDPSLNWGVAVYSYTDDKRVLIQAGAFRSGTDGTGTAIGDENDLGVTGRLVFVPWYDESDDRPRLVHLGGAVSQRFAKNDAVTFSQGPQSTLLQTGENPLTPFVPNITVPATQDRRYNVQAGTVVGPWSVQAEWTGTSIDQTGGGPVFLQGAYVLASYFLTGEHRRYDREAGAFLGPRVRSPFVCRSDATDTRSGPGAWELTARLAWLSFADPDLPPVASGLPVGTRLTTLTVGVNWYLTAHARVMLNYVRAVPTDPTFGSSTADSVTIRTAVFW